MQVNALVKFLSGLIQLTTPNDNRQEEQKTKPVLRDYPECGQIGREESKECHWDCDWQPIGTRSVHHLLVLCFIN